MVKINVEFKGGLNGDIIGKVNTTRGYDKNFCQKQEMNHKLILGNCEPD